MPCPRTVCALTVVAAPVARSHEALSTARDSGTFLSSRSLDLLALDTDEERAAYIARSVGFFTHMRALAPGAQTHSIAAVRLAGWPMRRSCSKR